MLLPLIRRRRRPEIGRRPRGPAVRATARHGYFRLRDEGYTPADLERWAEVIAAQGSAWDDVFVYFKHEDGATGPPLARKLTELLA